DLTASVKFSTGETQKDSFAVHVLPLPPSPQTAAKVALFDTKGETGKLLAAMGVRCQPVNASADLAGYDLLIVGKGALTVDGPAPNISRVRDGLKVILFEQTAEVLEKRFGFRVTEYGLRQVFRRIPDHPLLAGLDAEHLRDWRGEATILPPRLNYELSRRLNYTPTVKWCGIEVTRVWRCGSRGNVASVLIEKPTRGDFLPILDGGFSLQYSPLMEFREGKGRILFCQMDVTGRTEDDPAATRLVKNILSDLSDPSDRSPRRKALYTGAPLGKRHLELAGISPAAYAGGKLSADQVLVVSDGGGKPLAANTSAIADFLKGGGHILALGLDEQEANSFLPFKVRMKNEEHIANYFEPPGASSLLAGVGPSDAHNRGPRELPLLAQGAKPVGNGVLAKAENANVVFWQLPPWAVTQAEGSLPSFVVDGADAQDGKQSALVSLGTTSEFGIQFGQGVKITPQVGKSYTFAVFVKGVGGPISVHLEVERAGRPWDRAIKGPKVLVPENKWTDVHVTFK
ncbi:MAG: hypothetical protein FJ272_22900, partial [Planctomycetes bacterium]|nr:hypothetical protein [Planctomycetota bacterium]